MHLGTTLSKTAAKITDRSGIFWNIYGEKGSGDIGHSGSDPSILSFIYFNPETGLDCVLTTNTDSQKRIDGVVEIWQLLVKNREKIQKN